jgi:hypothetical protein
MQINVSDVCVSPKYKSLRVVDSQYPSFLTFYLKENAHFTSTTGSNYYSWQNPMLQ